MKSKKYSTIGGLAVTCLVYESVEEADAASGKVGSVLDSANDNFYYRGGTAEAARNWVVEKLESLQTPYPADQDYVREGKTFSVKAGDPIVRFTTPALDKEKKPRIVDGKPVMTVLEADGEFVNRYLALVGKEDASFLQPDFDAWQAAVPVEDDEGKPTGTTAPLAVSAKAAERKAAGPKKLAEKYKDLAAIKLMAGDDAIAKFNKNILSKIDKTFVPTGNMDVVYEKTINVAQKDKTIKPVAVKVSDADATALGWMVKEYFAWKEAQDAAALAA